MYELIKTSTKDDLMNLIKLFLITLLFTSCVTAQNLQFALVGDAGRWNKNTQVLKESLKSYKTFDLVMPGDNLYDGTYEKAWNPWIQDGFKFPVVALGNHNDTYQKEIAFFNMPGEYFSKKFTDGQLQYMVLNSDNKNNISEQMVWLENELTTSTAKQIYLVYHHPSRTVASHTWGEKKAFHLALTPIISKHRSKITALIIGHDHIAALIHFNNLPVIISGSTQNPRTERPVNNVQSGITVRTDLHYDSEPYWVQQIVNNNNSDFVFIRAKDNKVMCKANIVTGQEATYDCK